MRNNKEKVVSKNIGQENEELMKELEKIQKNIEAQEIQCQAMEKENQKLRMLQNFSSVFSKTQTNKDSVIVSQVISDLEKIKAQIIKEINEIVKLRKEKAELTGKIGLMSQELGKLKPSTTDVSRRMERDLSLRDLSFRFE